MRNRLPANKVPAAARRVGESLRHQPGTLDRAEHLLPAGCRGTTEILSDL